MVWSSVGGVAPYAPAIGNGGWFVSIGETLASARRDAGLSIADISSQTHIRLSVINDIEHDNYAACGGDHRARGTIAAIAQALDVDSGPLIEEYEAARRPAGWIVASEPSEPTIAEAPEASAPEDEPAPVRGDGDTQPIAIGQPSAPTEFGEPADPTPIGEPADPVSIGEPADPIPVSEPSGSVSIGESADPVSIGEPADPVTVGESTDPIPVAGPVDPVTIGGPTDPIMPAGSAIRAGTLWASGPVRPTLTERRPLLWIVLGGALVAAAALGGILLLVGTSGQAARHAVADGRHHAGGRAGARPARTRPSSPGDSASSPGRIRSASPQSSPPGQALAPASIAAFGPGGAGQGDSPQLARQALAGRAAAPWRSAWYATSHFGNLQSGTGLLLDMGRPVTITSARISLGNRSGADLALRIGSSPSLASLPPVARANGVGGVVRLKTAPTRGRYVLVWFTRLPPDQAGTFQASVYDIKLRGQP